MDSDILDYEEEENNEPKIKRSVSVIQMVQDWIEKADSEVAESSATNFGKQPYPTVAVIDIILKTLTQDAHETRSQFELIEYELNQKYGNPLYKEYDMTYVEASKRLHNLHDLWKSSGAGYIDEKYAYYPDIEPDSINFEDWGED